MFGLYGRGSDRRRGRYALRVAAVATVLVATAQPVQAIVEPAPDGTGASAGSGQIGALAYYEGGARPGPSNCTVTSPKGEARYFFGVSNPDGSGVVKREGITEFEQDGSAASQYDETDAGVDENGQPVDSAITDAQEELLDDMGDSDPNGLVIDAFSTPTVDGKFDVDGDTWTVYRVWCGDDRDVENDPPNIVAVPDSPLTLAPAALDFIREFLPDPELELLPKDEENGWVYVQVPVDFRTPPETLVGATITADTGGPEDVRRFITVTAVADEVVFESGDEDPSFPQVDRCPAAVADFESAPYGVEPGECSFTYSNASSVVEGSDKVFEATLSITWLVSYVDPTGIRVFLIWNRSR